MRVVRLSRFPGPTEEPTVSIVMRECDLKDTIEATIVQTSIPGCLVVPEIFDVPDGTSIAEITLVAEKKQASRKHREADMAVGYHWWARTLRQVNPGGIITSTKPAPLSKAELTVVLEQLARHPDYQNQTVLAITEDGAMIELRAGRVVDPGIQMPKA